MRRLRRRIDDLLGTEQTPRGGYPRLDLMIFGAAVAGAVVLVGADFYMRHVTKSLAELTDIDGQKNLTTWFQSSILLGAALSAFLIVPTMSGGRRRAQWAVLGSGLAFFSLDKSISLHEQVGRGLVNTFSLSDAASRIAWEAAWSPIILATAAALLLCVWDANRTTKLWACAMLAGGGIKLVMEALMFPAISYAGVGEHGVFIGLEVELEESIQLLGFACLFAGLAQFFIDQIVAQARLDTAPQVRSDEEPAAEPIPIRRAR